MVKRKRDANKIIVVGFPEGTDSEALEVTKGTLDDPPLTS